MCGAMGTMVVGNSRTAGVDPAADPDARTTHHALAFKCVWMDAH